MDMDGNVPPMCNLIKDHGEGCLRIGLIGRGARAHIDAQDRMIRHDIIGAASVDLRRIDGQAVADQCLQP